MSNHSTNSPSRREFLGTSGAVVAAAGLGGALHAEDAPPPPQDIQWRYPKKKVTPIGPMDLILQLEEGQKLADESLIAYGTVEPANGGSGGRTMRGACMPAEACAVYYAMTGKARTLQALKSAIRTFRTYRDQARGRRVRFENMEKPVPLDFEHYPEDKPTIEYEMGAVHVGRNMMGMRAAAHVLEDRQLLEEAADELRWWLDIPFAFNKGGHFFYGAIVCDGNGKPVRNSHGYILNMSVSLACALWLVGYDLGDERMMRYGKEAILQGLPPHQEENGYFPYIPGYKWSGPYRQDGYHGLICQKLSLLLRYKEWRENEKFMTLFRRAVGYMRDRLWDNGMVETKPDLVSIKELAESKDGYAGWKPLWESTSDLALISARMHRYLGEEDAMEFVHKPLRWLHWNSPSCIPFWPNDEHPGMWHLRTENSYSHCFRRIVLTAYEGIHLEQKGIRDVEAVFVA